MTGDFLEKVICPLLPSFSDENKCKERFSELSGIVKEVNSCMNITAVDDPKETVLRHFADSLLLFKTGVFTGGNQSCADIGSGGGFPGLPLAIADEKLDITLIDATEKKINYLKETAKKLGLTNVSALSGRAEELTDSKNGKMREKFDIVTARGVARLSVLSELCIPFLKVGGVFLAMKGLRAEEELEEAKKGIKMLGGEILETSNLVPDQSFLDAFRGTSEENLVEEFLNMSHNVIVIKKTAHTPKAYPRGFAQIKKKPL